LIVTVFMTGRHGIDDSVSIFRHDFRDITVTVFGLGFYFPAVLARGII